MCSVHPGPRLLCSRAAWIDKCRPTLLITESTYATTIRDSKRCRERDFLKKVHETVERGGKVPTGPEGGSGPRGQGAGSQVQGGGLLHLGKKSALWPWWAPAPLAAQVPARGRLVHLPGSHLDRLRLEAGVGVGWGWGLQLSGRPG